MATRREFLGGALAACAVPAFAGKAPPRLVSAAKLGRRDGGVLWREGGLDSFVLPARGHAPVHMPDGRVLMMSRRPGLHATLIDANDPARSSMFTTASRFSGHAAVSPDGATLVTGEFDAESFAAEIALRDPVTGAERVRWRPGGIEVHELLFARGGSRLVVALGGLIQDGGVAGPAVHPGGIDSAVLELDALSGKLLARRKVAFPSLSLRHLAVTPDGTTVAVAAQDQDIAVKRPLVGLIRAGGEIEFLSWPDPHDFDFRSYVGSVAIDAAGAVVAAASPRGGVLGFWSVADGRWLGGLAIADVCGLAAASEPGMFWASSGLGNVLKLGAAPPRIDAEWRTQAGFDNHLLRL